jgi:hypothetical protein
VGLVETWVEERSWKKIEKMLPKDWQVEKPMGIRRKEKGTSYRGNNNRGEIGDQRKESRKGRRRRMERNVHIERVVENINGA